MFRFISSLKSIAVLAFVLLATLLAYPAMAGQASLAWNASASTNVTGYKIHYGTASGAYSTHLDAGNALSATVPSLNSGATYYFAVTAYNSAGESGYSNEASARIPTAADTQAPTAPTNQAAVANGTSAINLTWTASTDNVGVTGYRVERCQGASCTSFTEVGTSASTSFSNTGLTASTSYRYRVRAADAAGNLSGYSSVASASTTAAAPPVLTADFTATPTSGNAPLATTFTATGSSGLTTFNWDLGDGTKVSGAKVSHTYAASGNYTVTLNASGTAGSAPTVTKTNFIQTGNALQAAFAANRTSGVAPMRVRFDDQSSGTINSYSWNFGDGTTGTDPNPAHTYRKPGTYVAKLTVTGPAGTSPEKAMTITVAAANDLVVDYGDGAGIYMYANNATTPTLLTSVASQRMVTVDIDRNGQNRVLVDHGTGLAKSGLWLYKSDGTSQQVDARSAVSLTVGDIDGNGIDDVIADFGSGQNNGIWWIRDLSVKTQIGTTTANQIVLWDENDLHDDTPELFASIAGIGIQMYSFVNGNWYPYDTHVPVWMAAADINRNGYDDLVIDFGPGPGTAESTPAHGIWALLDGATTWMQLDVNSGLSAIKADFDASNYDDLVVAFGTGQKAKTGLWGLYNGNTWSKISDRTSKRLIAADLNADGRQNVVADFGRNKGIMQWQDGSSWATIVTRTAKGMAAGQFK